MKTDDIKIQRGVRQGCVLSPLLFNIYSEAIFSSALEGRNEGIVINGKTVNNIRYADDTVLLASTLLDLQILLDLVDEESSKIGIKINIKKTKFMILSDKTGIPERLVLKGKPIERVDKFKYLGSWLSIDGNDDIEIRTRIEMARQAFLKMKNLLCNKSLDINTRLRTVRCYVWSVLLYGAETWTLKKDMINKLQAFEMWTYRRMLKIPWTAKVRNEEVLARLNKDVELIKTIKRRKTAYLGHILRGHSRYELLRLVLQGRIEGKGKRGRRKLSWMDNIKSWTGLSYEELRGMADDRKKFAEMVADLR